VDAEAIAEAVERKNMRFVPIKTDDQRAEKTPSAWKRSALPLYRSTTTAFIFPTEVCIGTARTKEQSQRRVCNLIPIMVFNDRPTCKDRPAAELILARSTLLHQKAEYIAADLSSRPNFPLAVARRTIH